MPPSIAPDKFGLYHPAKESEIIDLINYASQNKLKIRVRGAAQSVKEAVYTDGYSPAAGASSTDINMELDQMRALEFDDSKMQVTVDGGCNLGWDPFDPSEMSTRDDGSVPNKNLLYQLNKHGWGIQNVPDAIHQTIAGYISTGSQSGSMQHSFDDCIVAIRLIDGTGTAKTFTRSPDPEKDPENLFYAVGVSMGLLGVITQVTLQCVATFNIIGQEKTTNQDACEFDFLETGNAPAGTKTLQEYINDTEFTRLLWWPFPTLQRMIAWKARTMQPSDYDPNTSGTPTDFNPSPYKPIFPKLFGSTLISQAIAGLGYRFIANYPQSLINIFGNTATEATIKSTFDFVAPILYPRLIDMYFPCVSEQHPPQQFWDHWNGSLPMDTVEFSNNLFNLVYTELWISIDQAHAAIKAMNDFYITRGIGLTSYYTVEILASKKSYFWMSPAYDQDVIRLNIMRFDTDKTKDIIYYQQFWDMMKQFNFRLHWGKYLPPPNELTEPPADKPKPNPEGPPYLAGQYSKWHDFLNLRAQMDPHNIFLTSYWESQLGLN